MRRAAARTDPARSVAADSFVYAAAAAAAPCAALLLPLLRAATIIIIIIFIVQTCTGRCPRAPPLVVYFQL